RSSVAPVAMSNVAPELTLFDEPVSSTKPLATDTVPLSVSVPAKLSAAASGAPPLSVSVPSASSVPVPDPNAEPATIVSAPSRSSVAPVAMLSVAPHPTLFHEPGSSTKPLATDTVPLSVSVPPKLSAAASVAPPLSVSVPSASSVPVPDPNAEPAAIVSAPSRSSVAPVAMLNVAPELTLFDEPVSSTKPLATDTVPLSVSVPAKLSAAASVAPPLSVSVPSASSVPVPDPNAEPAAIVSAPSRSSVAPVAMSNVAPELTLFDEPVSSTKPLATDKIGRASCRERVQSAAVAVARTLSVSEPYGSSVPVPDANGETAAIVSTAWRPS